MPSILRDKKAVKTVIGRNIRALRLQSGKSIAELCRPQGWSRAYWNDLERGEKSPGLLRLIDIARVLSEATGRPVSPQELLATNGNGNGSKRKIGTKR